MNYERVATAAWNVLGAMDALGKGDLYVCQELRKALLEDEGATILEEAAKKAANDRGYLTGNINQTDEWFRR